MELLEMLVIGFTIGLTGALVPGPMLFATIQTSLTKGWTSGPLVVSGHALIELIIFFLIVGGFSTLSAQVAVPWISVLGGAVLVVFGVMTVKSGKGASLSNGGSVFSNPFTAGVITSISHPYFWLWWLTAGAGLVLLGLKTGILVALVFLVGHFMADLGWYTLVSTAFCRGRSLMSDRTYRLTLMGCGAFLVVFGIWFIASQLS